MAALPQFSYLASGAVVASGLTRYWLAYLSVATAEADRQWTLRTAGTFSKLEVIVTANTIATSATTVRVRKNAANGNQSVSIGAGATGSFQDATNVDTFGAGDKFAYQCVTPATSGSITASAANVLWQATGTTSLHYIARNAVLGAGTSFCCISGGKMFDATEASVRHKFRAAGTMKNLFTYVSANTYASGSAASTIQTRKNGANGNMAVSIPATSTGAFEDTTNTDTLASGDFYDLFYTATTGGNVTFGIGASVEFFPSGDTVPLIASMGVNTFNANNNIYTGPGADGNNAWTSEAPVLGHALTAFTVAFLAVYVTANTVTATSTVKVRKNGANGNGTLSITSGATGLFEDVTNSDVLDTGDTLNYQFSVGATGTTLTVFHIDSMATLLPRVGQPLVRSGALVRAARW